MANWTIDFMSRTGKKIHVSIAGATGNNDISLTPAEVPFTTEEEGREDLFIPVKTQSGYINVITDDLDLARNIIPIEGGVRKVTVLQKQQWTDASGTLLWQGYVQPKMLSMRLWQGKLKLAIPVECPLSALKYRTFAATANTMTIARIIYNMTGDFTNNVFQSTYIGNPGDAGGGASYYKQYSWLAKQVYMSLFSEKEYSQLEVMEKICTFFGWTLRSQAETLYFLMSRNVDSAAYNSLTTIARAQLISDTPTSTSSSWNEQEITESMFADGKTEIVMFKGCKDAVVECSLEEFDERFQTPDSDIKTAINDQTIPLPAKIDTTQETGEIFPTWYWTNVGPIQNVGGWTVETLNCQIILDKHDSTNVDDWTYQFNVLNTPKSYWYDEGSLTQGPSWGVDETYPSQLTLTRNSVVSFVTNGGLKIKFARGSGINQKFSIKIGNLYYNPSTGSWEQNSSICYAINNEFTVNIPSGGLSGELTLIVYGYDDSLGYEERTTIISGISFEFTPAQEEEYSENKNEVKFVQSSGSAFADVKSFDSDICLKDSYIKSSMNLLLENDGTTYCTSLNYGPNVSQDTFNPLQILANEAAEEGGKVGEMIKHKIRTDNLQNTITPLSIIYIGYNIDAMLYPASFEYDWQDDTLKMNLIKREYTGIL